MPRRRYLLLLVLTLGACGGDDTSEPHHDEPLPADPLEDHPAARVAESEGGSFRVGYTPDPDPIPVGDFALEIVVVGVDGPLPEDLLLGIDARMPDHGHGMVGAQPVVERTADDTFQVTGMDFFMPGYWQIEIVVGEAGSEERAMFDVDVAP